MTLGSGCAAGGLWLAVAAVISEYGVSSSEFAMMAIIVSTIHLLLWIMGRPP